jgi:hypothetical protein
VANALESAQDSERARIVQEAGVAGSHPITQMVAAIYSIFRYCDPTGTLAAIR